MRLSISFAFILAYSSSVPCLGQTPAASKISDACKNSKRVSGAFPTFKFGSNETYKGAPAVKYQINEDGSVSDAQLSRGSGIADIDKKVLEAVASWKYNPRQGCGAIETQMTVLIHFQ